MKVELGLVMNFGAVVEVKIDDVGLKIAFGVDVVKKNCRFLNKCSFSLLFLFNAICSSDVVFSVSESLVSVFLDNEDAGEEIESFPEEYNDLAQFSKRLREIFCI